MDTEIKDWMNEIEHFKVLMDTEIKDLMKESKDYQTVVPNKSNTNNTINLTK